MKKIIKFSTPYCQPCKVLEPILEKLIKSSEEEIYYQKVDVSESNEHNITSVPTVYLIKQLQDGTEYKDILVGFNEQIVDRIKKFIFDTP